MSPPFFGALLYTLAFPPYEWAWAAWFALAPLFLVLRRQTLRRAFAAGFVYAICWCVGVGYWVYFTLTDNFHLGFPLNALFLLANYAFYAGLPTGVVAVGIAVLLRRPPSVLTWLGVPALWVSGEALRANPWFGVSWGILGYTQYHHLPLIQVADVTGVYGLSFLIALGGLVAAEMWRSVRQTAFGSQQGDSATRDPYSALERLPWTALVGFLAGLGVILFYGTLRLWQYAAEPTAAPLQVAVVHGYPPTAQHWHRVSYASTLLKYLTTTRQGTAGNAPDLVVWPEFAVSFYLDREPLLQAQIGQFAQAADLALLLGAPRMEESAAGARYYNSAYLFSPDGRVVDVYDKIRLVPFAESRPLALPGLLGHTPTAPSEFTPGSRSTVFPLPRASFGVTICYEAAYPGFARRLARGGAHFLVNVSNDTWLGGAAAAVRQHFAMAVFRAVENKRDLVRAATAGISGFVDPTGRARLLSATVGSVIQSPVVPRRELTIYARYGDWFAVGCIALSCFALFLPPRGLGRL